MNSVEYIDVFCTCVCSVRSAAQLLVFHILHGQKRDTDGIKRILVNLDCSCFIVTEIVRITVIVL